MSHSDNRIDNANPKNTIQKKITQISLFYPTKAFQVSFSLMSLRLHASMECSPAELKPREVLHRPEPPHNFFFPSPSFGRDSFLSFCSLLLGSLSSSSRITNFVRISKNNLCSPTLACFCDPSPLTPHPSPLITPHLSTDESSPTSSLLLS